MRQRRRRCRSRRCGRDGCGRAQGVAPQHAVGAEVGGEGELAPAPWACRRARRALADAARRRRRSAVRVDGGRSRWARLVPALRPRTACDGGEDPAVARCSGTGCRRSPRASPARSARGCGRAGRDRHDQPGGAEAALHGARVDEGLLHVGELAVAGRRPSTVVISRSTAPAAEHQAGARPARRRAGPSTSRTRPARRRSWRRAGRAARAARRAGSRPSQASSTSCSVPLTREADAARSAAHTSRGPGTLSRARRGEHADGVAAVVGGGPVVVDRAGGGRRPARRIVDGAARSATGPPAGPSRCSAAIHASASGRPQRHRADRAEPDPHACARPGRRRSAAEHDRDHHRVAGADLEELLRAVEHRHRTPA